MLVALDEPRSEPVTEQVPPAAVLVVERLGIDPVQTMHSGRQVFTSGRDDEVVVVGHQAKHLGAPFVAACAHVEQAQEPEVVVVIEVDRASLDATRGDVEGAVFGEHGARSASHFD